MSTETSPSNEPVIKIAPEMPRDDQTERFGAWLRSQRSYVRVVAVDVGARRATVETMRAKTHEPGIEPTGQRGSVNGIAAGELGELQRHCDRGAAIFLDAERISWDG